MKDLSWTGSFLSQALLLIVVRVSSLDSIVCGGREIYLTLGILLCANSRRPIDVVFVGSSNCLDDDSKHSTQLVKHNHVSLAALIRRWLSC